MNPSRDSGQHSSLFSSITHLSTSTSGQLYIHSGFSAIVMAGYIWLTRWLAKQTDDQWRAQCSSVLLFHSSVLHRDAMLAAWVHIWPNFCMCFIDVTIPMSTIVAVLIICQSQGNLQKDNKNSRWEKERECSLLYNNIYEALVWGKYCNYIMFIRLLLKVVIKSIKPGPWRSTKLKIALR